MDRKEFLEKLGEKLDKVIDMKKQVKKYVKRKQDKHVKEQKKGRLSDYYDR